jgi:hypothetical protein
MAAGYASGGARTHDSRALYWHETDTALASEGKAPMPEAAPARVFVSHHHSPQEDAFTARLVEQLHAAGADVWVDIDRIPCGDFVRKISEGLAGRQWLVLVMTPDALRSPWVQREVDPALHQVLLGRMLGIIPIVAAPCEEGDIPLLWVNLQRYDATNDAEQAFAGVLRALGLGVSLPPPQLLHPLQPQPQLQLQLMLQPPLLRPAGLRLRWRLAHEPTTRMRACA